MTSIVVLKSAVVIGDEFDLRALKKVQPLQRIGSEKMLLSCLRLLEQYELIEILDETDVKNVLCRFSQEFLRESLYQILLYRECKQQLHTAVADYLQNSAPSFHQDPEVEAEKLKQHLLLAQDIKSEDQLSYQSKTGLIVRRIQNIIISNPNSIVIQEVSPASKLTTSRRCTKKHDQMANCHRGIAHFQLELSVGTITSPSSRTACFWVPFLWSTSPAACQQR
jgi:hypothetical protein